MIISNGVAEVADTAVEETHLEMPASVWKLGIGLLMMHINIDELLGQSFDYQDSVLADIGVSTDELVEATQWCADHAEEYFAGLKHYRRRTERSIDIRS